MEACLAVEKDIDRVFSKFGAINEHARRVLSELTTQIENLKAELQNAPEDHVLTNLQVDLLRQTISKVKETVCRLATDHRDLHSTVSKVGKSIDRNFVADFSATSREDVFAGPDKIALINKVICQHFYRQGMHDVADDLAKDADLIVETCNKEAFTELNRILDHLKNRNLEPALEWAAFNQSSLTAQNSRLPFMLHRMKFIELLQSGPEHQTEAIFYARTHFSKFAENHEKDFWEGGQQQAVGRRLLSHIEKYVEEIQTIMGMLLYVPSGLPTSRYSSLMDEDVWDDMCEILIRDYCQLMGVCVNSPLATCISAGCTAIPALLNIKQVMMQRQVTGIWNGKDELPIEIDLGNDNRYHSMFACPILRQQSTSNNPPMRLICGHVISRDALNKLCSGNKMKCPYCPVEQTLADARLICF